MRKNKIAKSILILCCVLYLGGCASVNTRPAMPIPAMAGIYHQIKKGQTLWRIAKAYGVKLENITEVNRLTDNYTIYEGQLVFIPGALRHIEDLTLETDFKDGDFIWPVKGKISSFYGMRKNDVKNKGICIQTKEEADVLAARSGRIAYCSEEMKGYGKIIIIDHLDGYSTIYAYNAKNLVELNRLVTQGQVIAKAGRTNDERAYELYFEIRKKHTPQNPFFYLP
ncbi:MAG: peptidoglycan DD-metalloendopeptidase family protein [Candidatus Omnitrophota bacterium]